MKLILILGLILVGLLEIPLFIDLKIEQVTTKGEVKGEEVILQKPFKPGIQDSAPSLSSPSPRLYPSPISTPEPEDDFKALPQIVKEIVLLNQEEDLKDEILKIAFPELDQNQIWYLEVEFELISTEDVLSFDSPGFTIYIDDYLAYQRSAFEAGPEIINFNLATFSKNPQTLSIWSGNTGDELKETYSIIKKIKLIPKEHHDFIETTVIDDLVINIDNKNYFTLEWKTPKTNDLNLGKPLTYDIRYSPELMTPENWSQAQVVEIFLPQSFSPQAPNSKEVILINSPLIKSGYLAIRSIDSTGLLSPLGESVLFGVKD